MHPLFGQQTLTVESVLKRVRNLKSFQFRPYQSCDHIGKISRRTFEAIAKAVEQGIMCRTIEICDIKNDCKPLAKSSWRCNHTKDEMGKESIMGYDFELEG